MIYVKSITTISILISFTRLFRSIEFERYAKKFKKSNVVYTATAKDRINLFPYLFPPRYGRLFKFDRGVAKPEIGTRATPRVNECTNSCGCVHFLGRFRRSVSFALRVSDIPGNRKPEMEGKRKRGERSVIRSISYPGANEIIMKTVCLLIDFNVSSGAELFRKLRHRNPFNASLAFRKSGNWF